METKPRVVTLCGSTKFKAAFEEAAKSELLAGHLVFSVGGFPHADGWELTREQKALVDVLHFRKIDLSDEILVLNVGGYIGESTEREIIYAESLRKKIRYLEDPSSQL